MNRSRRGIQQTAHCGQLKFRFDADFGGTLAPSLNALLPDRGLRLSFWRGRVPVRIRHSRTPPITLRVKLLPEQPDFSRALRKQIFARKSVGHGKALSAF